MIEFLAAPAQPDGGGGVMAIVVRAEDRQPGTRFVTDPKDPQQVGVICRPAGWVSPPHYHPESRRPAYHGPTTEVLVVTDGAARLRLYALDTLCQVHERLLQPGDCVVLLSGGHSVEAVTDVRIVETKLGPFGGPTDKILIHPRAV